MEHVNLKLTTYCIQITDTKIPLSKELPFSTILLFECYIGLLGVIPYKHNNYKMQ